MATTNLLTALGAADIDTKELTANLVAATKEPRQKIIDKEKTRAEVAISNMALLKNGLSALANSASDIAKVSSLNKSSVISTNISVISGSSTNSKVAKAGNYDVTVTALAAPERESASFTRDFLSTKKIRIDLSSIPGSDPEAPLIVLDVGKTPSDINDAINTWIETYASEARVSATLVDTRTTSSDPMNPARPLTIIVQGAAGLENAFDVDMQFAKAAESDPATPDDWEQLPPLTFSTILGNNARDAEFLINGVTIRRSSNNIDDVIDGVSLELNSTSETPIKLTVSPDSSSVIDNVRVFVETYNTVSQFLKKATGPKINGDEIAGSLQSDSSARQVLRTLRSAVTAKFTAVANPIEYFNELGVRFDKNGTLQFFEAEFTEKFSSNPSAVITALGNNTKGPYLGVTDVKSGIAGDIANLSYKMVSSTGAVTSITKSYETILSRVEKKQTSLDEYINRLTAQYERQFTALNSALAAFKNTGAQLDRSLNFNNK